MALPYRPSPNCLREKSPVVDRSDHQQYPSRNSTPLWSTYVRSGLSVKTQTALACLSALLCLASALCLGAEPNALIDPAIQDQTNAFADTPSLEEGLIASDSLGTAGAGGKADVADIRSEVVVFAAWGRRVFDKVAVDDLDTIVTADNVRLIPVLRVMRAFQFEVLEEARRITCRAEGGPVAILDLDQGIIEVGGIAKLLVFKEAVSDITMKSDIYVTRETLSEILNMEIVWNEDLYEYRTQVARKLSIWKREEGPSGLAQKAMYVPPDLPELLPPAHADDAFIQFLEFRVRSEYEWHNRTAENAPAHTAEIRSPQETLWGQLLGGRYKLDVSHEGAVWTETDGSHWASDDPSFLRFNWGELIFTRPTGEVALGDSVFALGDMIFPWIRMSGIRANGLAGVGAASMHDDRSSLGMREYFVVPHVFEGVAPVGSTVDLLLNDRVMETERIISDPEAPPDSGTYRFEDVRLPQGILNEVVIRITETDGTETRVEKAILGSPLLLGAGRSAYLAGLGTNRDLMSLKRKSIDFGNVGGQIGGARLLYGLTDRLTVGGILGYQRDFYRRSISDQSTIAERFYPQENINVGAKLSWLALTNTLISADLARSSGDGKSKYNDTALRTGVEFLPTDKINLNAQFINVGSNYFDGQHLDFQDRRGGALSGRWRIHRQWLMEGAVGRLRDNLEDQYEETLVGDYQSFMLVSSVIPRTSVRFDFDRFDVNWEKEPKILSELNVRTALLPEWSLSSTVTRGDDLAFRNNHDFFSGFKLAGVPSSTGPGETWEISRNFTNWLRMSCDYRRSETTKTLTLRKNLRFQRDNPITVATEVIYDFLTDKELERYLVHNRIEYFLDRIGYNRVGLDVRWEDREWQLIAFLNIRQLFAQKNGRLKYVDNRRVRADQGAVQGFVFLDYNANAQRDPGEPGLPDITVKLGKTRSAVTDKNGYYILPADTRVTQARVFLDLNSAPAIYSPVHATQLANIIKGSLTEVNLSLTPLIAATGCIVVRESEDTTTPISGVRVQLIDAETKKLVIDSITARDGSYYIDACKPGKYIIQVDTNTLRQIYHLAENSKTIEITSTTEEFAEVTIPDFVAEPAPPSSD